MTFDYDQVRMGDIVEVSTTCPFDKPLYGHVTEAFHDCVNIRAMIGQEERLLYFCWHEDDERANPERFLAAQKMLSESESSEHGPQTGIFRIARNQQILQELPDKMAVLERLVERLSARVVALEEKAEVPSPRKRGRPRKTETAEPAVA